MRNLDDIAFIDLEVSEKGKILDAGAILRDATFHNSRISSLTEFIGNSSFLCGHNIVEHDAKYLNDILRQHPALIDTLYLSPLLFPSRPYHKLLKDDKILSEELNNPLNDCLKAKTLFEDELSAYSSLPETLQQIYRELLEDDSHFSGFFQYIGHQNSWKPFFLRKSLEDRILDYLEGQVCSNADIAAMLKGHRVELAYAIAIISAKDRHSLTPAWVLKNYPEVERILSKLRSTNCGKPDCPYCSGTFDSEKALFRLFGYKKFRTFGDVPLQKNAVDAALSGKSLLAIFPTGGGKSLTFQLPALVAGEAVRGLTVVISPLQSLMKDQVENLEKKGISGAVYINGLLSPIERRDALERVASGDASMLYIAPEQLRSKTIERILLSRTISRFVIDEAHCFSSWGQDFRIEYLYIGEFIRGIMEKKGQQNPIPVSCFTATAKPKVVSDICDYFEDRLSLRLERFTTDSARTNLHYRVLFRASKEEKYQTLRGLLSEGDSPAIVYVTRTKTAEELATKLCNDGFSARAFHGQMETRVKVQNQEDFMANKVRIIVATSAFGMGVDKSDVSLVVHYQISDSLENYIQEAGRAGRDVHSEADCYVLYNDDDLNSHFILLNQSKLTFSEINQVWTAIKQLTSKRSTVTISPLEIARKAGWDELHNVETKVKSAVAALENAGYVKRGTNCPRIFATSINPRNMDEAAAMIEKETNFTQEEKVDSRRIIHSLISERSRAAAGTADAESRIDYLSDMLGIEIGTVIRVVEKMKAARILSNGEDMTAWIKSSRGKSLENYLSIEKFLSEEIFPGEEEGAFRERKVNLKELNEKALESGGIKSGVKEMRTVLFFWTIKKYVEKHPLGEDNISLTPQMSKKEFLEKFSMRASLCRFIRDSFWAKAVNGQDETQISFSLVGLMDAYNREGSLFGNGDAEIQDVEDALLFLAKTGVVSIEGGFMVLYNKLQIERLKKDNHLRYRKEDYQSLNEFYRQRIQQIHIVGKYANMMVSNERSALEYVHDYFTLEFKKFIRKYFDARQQDEISRNISPRKYQELFGSLTDVQKEIISDKESQYIVVPAGPGSGKTYVLVRKLASLLLLEDVKSEQLLMLTFSRAAATEFKNRLRALVGGAAEYVQIKTFHSYSFDLLGRPGSIDESENVVEKAVEAIRSNSVERSQITKAILVIDEAQDMGEDEFALVEQLIARNDAQLRVIAVGDDDQNIYEFRGSDSSNMRTLITKYRAKTYKLLKNFRSTTSIIDLANIFVRSISGRLKNEPIYGCSEEKGSVRLHLHRGSDYFENAIVSEISKDKPIGTTAVLTATNENALILTALLSRCGHKARLVQSNDGFKLSNLAELHYFIDKIRDTSSIKISEENWSAATDLLKTAFRRSQNTETALNCLKTFYNEFKKDKYVTDLTEFLNESSIETFTSKAEDEIIVSTIHKSKGCEYDNVYMSLEGMKFISNRERRAVYVGMTRAKKRLSIHYDNDIFKGLEIPVPEIDPRNYPSPDELTLQLSFKDVVLDDFLGKERLISKLMAGDPLTVIEDCLYTHINGYAQKVAKFSEKFQNTLATLQAKGYVPEEAKVRFVVYWRYENRVETANSPKYLETPIVLADIKLRKSDINNKD